ncbi:hypothetical protein D9M68_838070 [compost metagenome]
MLGQLANERSVDRRCWDAHAVALEGLDVLNRHVEGEFGVAHQQLEHPADHERPLRLAHGHTLVCHPRFAQPDIAISDADAVTLARKAIVKRECEQVGDCCG